MWVRKVSSNLWNHRILEHAQLENLALATRTDLTVTSFDSPLVCAVLDRELHAVWVAELQVAVQLTWCPCSVVTLPKAPFGIRSWQVPYTTHLSCWEDLLESKYILNKF